MLVNRQTINCAFAFSCKKFALFELTDPMRRKIFVQMFLQGEARLIALQVPKERLSGNLTSIGRICSNPLCLAGQYFLTGLWLKSIDFLNSLLYYFPVKYIFSSRRIPAAVLKKLFLAASTAEILYPLSPALTRKSASSRI